MAGPARPATSPAEPTRGGPGVDQQQQQAGASGPRVPYQTDEMISAKEVAQVTGLSRRRVAQAAAAGHLTVCRPPAGVAGLVRYGRRSAEALAASMVTPATATHPEPGPTGGAIDAR